MYWLFKNLELLNNQIDIPVVDCTLYNPQSGNDKLSRRRKYEKKEVNKNKATQKKDCSKGKAHKRSVAKPSEYYETLDIDQWKASKDFGALPVFDAKDYKFQMGIDLFDCSDFALNILTTKLGINSAESAIKEIENLTALMISISDCRTMKGVISALYSYIGTHFQGSVAKELYSYIFHEALVVSQSGSCDPDEESDWIKLLKDVRTRWSTCRGNGVFDNFCKVLSIISVAGLAKASDLTFSIGKFKLIEPNLSLLTANASDLISAVCDVAIFFSEKCYQSWKTNTLRPFLIADSASTDLEVEFNTLINYWNLYRSGNLVKIIGISEHEFLCRLETMGSTLKSMIPLAKSFDKRVIEGKFRDIIKIINDFTMIKVNSGFKVSPFAIEYYGKSKVGKSTVSEQISHYLLTSASLPTEDGFKYTHISGKKHWDGARSDMVELKLDDHANTRQEFVESSPCDVIIKVCNNVPYSPPMADLNDKGKVFVEPALVSVTTNVQDLDARVYSNAPYSVQRRMHYILEVRVKEEFCEASGDAQLGIDTSKVIASHTKDGIYDPPTYHDVWELDIKYAIPGASETTSGSYEIVEHEGIKLKSVSMKVALNFLCTEFHKHREQQNKLYEAAQQQDVKKEDLCGVDGCKQLSTMCCKHYQQQMGLETLMQFTHNILDGPTLRLLEEARNFYNAMDWVPYVPNRVLNHYLFKNLYTIFFRNAVWKWYKIISIINISTHVLLFVLGSYFCDSYQIGGILCLCLIVTLVYIQYILIYVVRDYYYNRLHDRGIMSDIQRQWHNKLISFSCVGATLLSAAYVLAKAYKNWNKMMPQGSLEPRTFQEVLKRDREENPWTNVVTRSLPVSDLSKSSTIDRLCDTVSKNLLFGSCCLNDKEALRMNAVMLTSNVLLMPYHYFEKAGADLKCTFRKNNPDSAGGQFATCISLDYSYHVPGTDLAICYTPNGGSFKNITEYFPLGDMPATPFRLLWRDRNGKIVIAKGRTQPCMVNAKIMFRGGIYENFNMDTFSGLCGAPVLSETSSPTVLGIHLAGIDGERKGAFGLLTQNAIKEGLKFLRSCEGTLLTGEAKHFPTEILGVKVIGDKPRHPKSPVNYMPQCSQVEYFGSCPGRSVFKSDVKMTPISLALTEICGCPNIYGGPVVNPSWKGWQDCLANLSVPALPFPPTLLEMAVMDYKETLLPVFKNVLWNGAKPLTDHENLNGIPGQKFMDAIKLDTSVGFPLVGPKRKYVTEHEPTPECPNNRELDSFLMDEIKRCETCYANGERAYSIAKACKKDEILSKPKCRIFYSNALALTYLIRKYFLPILRVLQMNPLVSECAVGINAHGPEWEEFYTHAMQFGKDRIFGGDYGKYDQKLPSQLIISSLRVLIDCARVCQYSEKDLNIMETMVGDIVYAIIAYDGDLIGLTEGTHISGNSLTVVINGICGSLNLRCFFYTQYPTLDFYSRMKFREWVAVMTYGDDNIGSVRRGADKFNIKACSEFLAEYGQEYTMPDKESALSEFLPEDQFEFLKRTSVFHPALNQHVGALVEKSIFKSLHCFMRPKGSPLTEDAAAALNIDTALREWFNHGESVYEKRRSQMFEVAKQTDITHMCTRLNTTYDDCVVEWRSKYDSTYNPEILREDQSKINDTPDRRGLFGFSL